MSAKLMGHVFELDVTSDEQIILLALADHARDDGTSVYPRIGYLAWKTNRSVRSVQRTLRQLEEQAFIELVDAGTGGRKRTRTYVLHLDRAPLKPKYEDETSLKGLRPRRVREGENGATDAPLASSNGAKTAPIPSRERVTPAPPKGDTGSTKRVTPTSPPLEPSVNHQQNHHSSSARETEIRAALLVALFSEPPRSLPPDMQEMFDEAVATIVAFDDATPEEVRRRVELADRTWSSNMLVTPRAIARNWPALGRSRSPIASDRPPEAEELRAKYGPGGKYHHLFTDDTD